VFAERYRIERRLAAGGMGAVYEVVHLETNRRRALKVLHGKFVERESVRHRFRQEARVTAEIESEYIVDVFDAGIDTATGMPFLVMELLRGEDVRSRVRRDGPLPPEDAIRHLHEICLALEKTHQANIVHRDLKPDNLFLCERDHGPPRIKVLDFGIAKMVAHGTTQAHTTQALGTPLYMAPEQFSMDSKVSPATDIYALGLIAYTMLVGKPYWAAEAKAAGSPIVFALQASQGPKECPVARAARRNICLPPAFDAWFFRAVAPNPSDRFPSAMSAIVELADVLGLSLPVESSRHGSGPLSRRTLRPPPLQTPVVSAPDVRPIHGADVQPPSEPSGSKQVTITATPEGLPVVRTGPSSATAHALPALAASRATALRPQRRGHPLLVMAGVLAMLSAGRVVDTMLVVASSDEPVREHRPPENQVDASSGNVATIPTATEIHRAASASAMPSLAALPAMSTVAPAVSSATSPSPTTTKPHGIRPSVTRKQSPDGVLWNND